MTSLGRSPRKPKESSGRSSYPTAGDFAAESEVVTLEALTEHDEYAYEIDVDAPSYDDPAVPGSSTPAALAAAPEAPAKPAKTRKPVRAKEAREPKPPKPVKEKAPKAAKPAREPKPPKPSKTPRPPRIRNGEPSRVLMILATVAGVLGLVFSLVLAVGTFFVALDASPDNSFFMGLSDVCDALVGPLKDVFTFSGANAERKQALVGWGLGSLGYLLVGRFVQSLIQSRINS